MGREQLPNSRSSIAIYPSHNSAILQHSKSSGNMQQLQMAAARHAVQMAANMNAAPRAIMVSHPLQLGPIGVAMQTPQMPLVSSASSGNILHVCRCLIWKFFLYWNSDLLLYSLLRESNLRRNLKFTSLSNNNFNNNKKAIIQRILFNVPNHCRRPMLLLVD